jgi:hypothetical protein
MKCPKCDKEFEPTAITHQLKDLSITGFSLMRSGSIEPEGTYTERVPVVQCPACKHLIEITPAHGGQERDSSTKGSTWWAVQSVCLYKSEARMCTHPDSNPVEGELNACTIEGCPVCAKYPMCERESIQSPFEHGCDVCWYPEPRTPNGSWITALIRTPSPQKPDEPIQTWRACSQRCADVLEQRRVALDAVEAAGGK